MNLESISEEIKNCKKCELFKKRNNTVPGKGNPKAKIMFIGEAPGKNEDLQGIPFIGRAGDILSELLEEINLKREDIFITNIVKCRPPNNRDPTPEEIKTCAPFLEKQIQVIKPKVIITLGRFAMNYILKKYNLPEKSITQAHGEHYQVNTLENNLLIMPMYHPAATIYNPSKINDLKTDFKKLQKLIK